MQAAAAGQEPTLQDPNFKLTVQTSYATQFLGYAVALQPDGKILLGGNFRDFAGSGRSYLVRLNADGMVDDTFNSRSPSSTVSTITIQSDGKMLVAGPSIFLRVNSGGSPDTTFRPGIPIRGDDGYGEFQALVLASDKVLVAQHVSASNLIRIFRLNSDGSVDPSFDSSTAFSKEESC